MADPFIEVNDLTVSIGSVRVVDQLNFNLNAGQTLGVLGPNGIGKTTLLKTIAGVYQADRGEIHLQGRALEAWPRKALAQRLGLLLQHTHYAFEASCEDIALIGRHPHLSALARESDADRALARKALHEVGLGDFIKRSCMNLSGGESRRLALATLLVQDPKLMLLDEPTNHLDPAHQVASLNLIFERVKNQSHAAIMALHDANLAACYCSHVLLLFGQGEWAFGLTKQLLNAATLSRLYGCPIRCIKDDDQEVFAIGNAV
mgnify:CR=1 FL=1